MIKLLLLMILAHVVDDFVLQTHILSNLKQVEWWRKNAPDKKYQDDYIAALIVHSMSWSVMILLPAMLMYDVPDALLLLIFMFNTITHLKVDDEKANKHTLNLCQDQFIHLIQIVITWIILCSIVI